MLICCVLYVFMVDCWTFEDFRCEKVSCGTCCVHFENHNKQEGCTNQHASRILPFARAHYPKQRKRRRAQIPDSVFNPIFAVNLLRSNPKPKLATI